MSTPPTAITEQHESNGGANGSSSSPTKGAPNGGLVQSLLSEKSKGIGGAICNDRNGSCLAAKGAVAASTSGVFTSLTKLASQINPGSDPPLITIETDKAALLVKEYDGHAVALRVPVTAGTGSSSNAEKSSATQATEKSSS